MVVFRGHIRNGTRINTDWHGFFLRVGNPQLFGGGLRESVVEILESHEKHYKESLKRKTISLTSDDGPGRLYLQERGPPLRHLRVFATWRIHCARQIRSQIHEIEHRRNCSWSVSIRQFREIRVPLRWTVNCELLTVDVLYRLSTSVPLVQHLEEDVDPSRRRDDLA